MASFVGGRNKRTSTEGPALLGSKRAKISVYEEPPTGEVSLEEFEQFALDRMRVLKAIDSAKAKGVKPDELKEIIEKACGQYLPLRDDKNADEDRRKDQISHYVLRIAYSRTEDLRRWFLRQVHALDVAYVGVSPLRVFQRTDLDSQQEENLFKHRFGQLDAEGREHIQRVLNSKDSDETALTTVTQEEYQEYMGDLLRLFPSVGNSMQPWKSLYKVPFEDVPDLVATRRVFIRDGDAYVQDRDIISVIVSNFRLRLSKQLTENARAFYAKAEEEAERLGPLLQNLTNAYLGADYSDTTATGRITIDKLPLVMNRSAPLCMKNLFDKMTAGEHHLKHDGRMQFGLFLKGIGVTLEDSLAWWREQWMKGGKTSEQFDKQYSYNIRHNYGVEGKRTNYTPYSCMKIISSTPVGDGQHHGCPFKHWNEDKLRANLAKMRLGAGNVQDVMEKVKGQHYQVACLKVYEALHPGNTVDALSHPNQYFQASYKVYEAKAGVEDAAPTSTPQAPAAQQPTQDASATPMETQS